MAIATATLRGLYEQMLLIRVFETEAERQYKAARIAGSAERTMRRWWRSVVSAASGSRLRSASSTSRCSATISVR